MGTCTGMTSARSACAAVTLAAALGLALATTAFASPPRCAGSGLVVWLDTQGSGAAGSSYYKLMVTNLSGRTCTLSGSPRVAAVDVRSRQLGDASSRSVSSTPVVVLSRGASASAIVQIVVAGNFSTPACRPVTAAGLRVRLPGQSATRLVPFPFEACSRRGPIFLTVRALRRA